MTRTIYRVHGEDIERWRKALEGAKDETNIYSARDARRSKMESENETVAEVCAKLKDVANGQNIPMSELTERAKATPEKI